MSPILFLLLTAAPERVPLWVTFDVLNPRTLGGHRILHLEDVVGPRTRTDIPGLTPPRALLVYATTLDRVAKGGPTERAMEQLAKISGGMVVGLVLVDRESAERAKRDIPQFEYSHPLSVDSFGVLGQALKLHRPGMVLVVNSSAEVARLLPPSEGSDQTIRNRWLRRVEARYREALRQDGEDER